MQNLGSFDDADVNIISNITNDSNTTDHCDNEAVLSVSRIDQDTANPLTVELIVSPSSTATPGLDYEPLPLEVTIPAGAFSTEIPFIIFGDDDVEGEETIILSLAASCNCALSSTTFFINDGKPLEISANNVIDCIQDSVTLSPVISGGLPFLGGEYQLFWNGTIQSYPDLSVPFEDGKTYELTAVDFCQDTAIASIQLDVLSSPELDILFLDGECGLFQTIGMAASGDATEVEVVYSFNDMLSVDTISVGDTLEVTLDTSGLLYIFELSYPDFGCTVSPNEEVNIALDLLNVEVTEVGPSCFGNDGSITIEVLGGDSPFIVEWPVANQIYTFVDQATLSNLSEGVYEISVEDASSCAAQLTVELFPYQELELELISLVNPSCYASNDGVIEVEGAGGQPPYVFQWSNGESGNNVNSLVAGSYSLTLTDAFGCSIDTVFNLVEPDSLGALIAFDEVGCPGGEDGAISVVAFGGIPSYSFEWSTGDSLGNLVNLPEGIYEVTVSDQNGCSVTESVEVGIDFDLVLEVTPSSAVICDGEAVTLQATPGFDNYIWSDGQVGTSFIAVTEAGLYSVEAWTYGGSCVFLSEEVNVDVLPSPASPLIFGDFTPQAGKPAYYFTFPFGALSYEWDAVGGFIQSGQGTSTVKVLWPDEGQFTLYLTITNNVGCSTTAAILVTVGPVLNASNSSALKVFPNPVANKATVIFDVKETQQGLLELLDARGQRLFSQRVNLNTPYELDGTGMEPGGYWLKLIVDRKTFTTRIIIQK